MRNQTLERILDLARWAPSGDNTQPWRFQIVDDRNLLVFGHDTRDDVLYDFDGHPSHMAHGALLETIRIAASAEGLQVSWEIDQSSGNREPLYRVRFDPVPGKGIDPLASYIRSRVVQRRPMKPMQMSNADKQALVKAIGDKFEIDFFDTFGKRLEVACLLWKSAYIRLITPEAYLVHKKIIEWGVKFSKDKIPESAVGVDPFTARLMKWVMQSWRRVEFFNKYAFGTILPRIQLDFMPAIRCSSHILIRPVNPPTHLNDWVMLGASMQRFWLTATALGYHVQPQMTPVIFRWYARAGQCFSEREGVAGRVEELALEFEKMCGASSETAFGFFARMGRSDEPKSRSLRLELDELMK